MISNSWRHARFQPQAEGSTPVEDELDLGEVELSALWIDAAEKLQINTTPTTASDFISADDETATEEEVTVESVLADVAAKPKENEQSDDSDEDSPLPTVAPPTFAKSYGSHSTVMAFIMSSRLVPFAIQKSLANINDFLLTAATAMKQKNITDFFKPQCAEVQAQVVEVVPNSSSSSNDHHDSTKPVTGDSGVQVVTGASSSSKSQCPESACSAC